MKVLLLILIAVSGYFAYMFFRTGAPFPRQTRIFEREISHETHLVADQLLKDGRKLAQDNQLDEAWQTLMEAGRAMNMDEAELSPNQIRSGRKLRLSIMTEMQAILDTQLKIAEGRDRDQKQKINHEQRQLRSLRNDIQQEIQRDQNRGAGFHRNQRLNELRTQEQVLINRIQEMEAFHQHHTVRQLNQLADRRRTLQEQIALERNLID